MANNPADKPADKPERRTKAPVIALGIAVIAVIAVVLYSWLKPTPQLTVADLRTPVVAGINAGGDLYPPNSEFAVGEMAKFGYLPSLPVARTSDGQLVATTDDLARTRMGLQAPVTQTSAKDFLAARITPGNTNLPAGVPLTIDDALNKYGKATVFIFTVSTAEDAQAVLELVKKRSKVESVILRTTELPVIQAVTGTGVATLYAGTGDPSEIAASGATMVEVAADADIAAYTQAGLKVWVTGVTSPDQLSQLAGLGVYGALAGNPFSIQPSSVITD